MKAKTILLTVMALGCFSLGMKAMAQYYNNTTPGLLISGSCETTSLPKDAQKFLKKHFGDVAVKKCTHDFAQAVYKVKLTNKVEIEFANDGKVVEIEAADRTRLSEDIVKEVLPAKAYKYLKDNKVANFVEGIEYSKGRVVEIDLDIPGPDNMIFDLDGTFLVITD